MTRIVETDTTGDMIMKLADGNPGALSVLCKVVKEAQSLFLDGCLYLFFLDFLGIYGSDIWVLYKDDAGRDIVKFSTILRGMIDKVGK